MHTEEGTREGENERAREITGTRRTWTGERKECRKRREKESGAGRRAGDTAHRCEGWRMRRERERERERGERDFDNNITRWH